MADLWVPGSANPWGPSLADLWDRRWERLLATRWELGWANLLETESENWLDPRMVPRSGPEWDYQMERQWDLLLADPRESQSEHPWAMLLASLWVIQRTRQSHKWLFQ